MYSYLSTKKIQNIIMFFWILGAFSTTALEARKEDVEEVHEALHEKSKKVSEEIREVNSSYHKLVISLLACVQDQKHCRMIHEYIDDIQHVLNKSNRLEKIDEKLHRCIRNRYLQIKENSQEWKMERPRPLTEEEKKLELEERFSREYIGGIPSGLKSLVKYMKSHDRLSKTKVSKRRKVLLYGNPGSGKSYLPEVLSVQLQMPIVSINATELEDKFYGETPRKIREILDFVESQNEPVILLIDEIDAIARDRKSNTDTPNRSAVNALLTALEKLEKNKNVFVFVTTNHTDTLDEAFKDRFIICEIKDFTLEQRAQFIMKTFRDNGRPVDAAFAKRLAEVTSKKTNTTIEYKAVITGTYIDLDLPTEEVVKEGVIAVASSAIGLPDTRAIVQTTFNIMGKGKTFPQNLEKQIKPKVGYIPSKINPEKYYISLRDLKDIIGTAVINEIDDSGQTLKSSGKPMCQCVRMALDELGIRTASYAEKPTYCCGI